jgi:hypothetical protein
MGYSHILSGSESADDLYKTNARQNVLLCLKSLYNVYTATACRCQFVPKARLEEASQGMQPNGQTHDF